MRKILLIYYTRPYTLAFSMYANVKCNIARFWREIFCGNLRNTTRSLQKNEGTNNILFISIKGKNVLVTALLLFVGLKRNPAGAWRKCVNAVYHRTTNDGTENSLWKRNE